MTKSRAIIGLVLLAATAALGLLVTPTLSPGDGVLLLDSSIRAPILRINEAGTVTGYGSGAATDAARGVAFLAAVAAAGDGDLIEVYADASPAFTGAILSTTGKLSFYFAPGVRISKGNVEVSAWGVADGCHLYVTGGIFDDCLLPHPAAVGGSMTFRGSHFITSIESSTGWVHNEAGGTQCYFFGVYLEGTDVTATTPFELETPGDMHIDAATTIVCAGTIAQVSLEGIDWLVPYGTAANARDVLGAAAE